MTDETNDDVYPIMEQAANAIRTSSGRSLSEITMDDVESGDLVAEDIRIAEETLQSQAEIARRAALAQLADNLTRASELTAVPNATLLEMYEMLRPGRSSYAELTTLATILEEQFNARENARFVREAADVYQTRGLLRRELSAE